MEQEGKRSIFPSFYNKKNSFKNLLKQDDTWHTGVSLGVTWMVIKSLGTA